MADRPLDELAPFFAFGLLTLLGDVRVTGAAIPAATRDDLAGERDSWLELAHRFAHRPRLT